MARPSKHDRARTRVGRARTKRTTINLVVDAEVALKLYALRMRTYRGRERSVSFAIEHILYQNDDLKALLPEARKIIDEGGADDLRVYRPSRGSDQQSNPKQEQQSESEGGQSTTTSE